MSYIVINENSFFINDGINEYDLIMQEGASFDVMPKFNKMCSEYPELKKNESLIKECNELLKDNDMNEQKAKKISQVVLRVLRFYLNIVYILNLPLMVFITPIIGLLLNRLLVWAIESGDFSIARKTNNKAISELEELKRKTKDPKVAKKCTEMINKIEENNRKLL